MPTPDIIAGAVVVAYILVVLGGIAVLAATAR
jgi:hypothetical protein